MYHLPIIGSHLLQGGVLIKTRRTWYSLVLASGVDGFLSSVVASAIYKFHGYRSLRLFTVLFFGVGAVTVIAVAVALTRQYVRQVQEVKKMYVLALLPGFAMAQVACAVWGHSTVWVIIAGTCFQVSSVTC